MPRTKSAPGNINTAPKHQRLPNTNNNRSVNWIQHTMRLNALLIADGAVPSMYENKLRAMQWSRLNSATLRQTAYSCTDKLSDVSHAWKLPTASHVDQRVQQAQTCQLSSCPCIMWTSPIVHWINQTGGDTTELKSAIPSHLNTRSGHIMHLSYNRGQGRSATWSLYFPHVTSHHGMHVM